MPETEHERKGAGRHAFLLALGALALGIFLYSGIHGRVEAESNLQHATEQAAIEDVNVVCPKAAAPIDEVILPGATQPFVNSPIYARTNGYLVKWFYDIGAKVKQGDLLAIIDTPELDKQLEQARADLASAKSNLALSTTTAERWKGLVKTRSVSQQSTDQAVDNLSATQASVDSYAANVRRLEDMVSFEKVYAPFDGVITVRNTDTGWLINAGAGQHQKARWRTMMLPSPTTARPLSSPFRKWKIISPHFGYWSTKPGSKRRRWPRPSGALRFSRIDTS
jgi:multidrug efflux pump subunit AcrA (membrane-fusion protein)